MHCRGSLADVPADPVIFLSWEGFSGVMPGHRRWLTGRITTYTRAAIPLARTVISELRHRFGDAVIVEFLHTLRDTDQWIHSVYGHLLRSIRITDNYGAFRGSFPSFPDLKNEAATIARAIAPIPVHTAWLEDTGAMPQGPATAFFDLIDLSPQYRTALPKAEQKNPGLSDEAHAMFPRLNREIADASELKHRKEKIACADRAIYKAGGTAADACVRQTRLEDDD